jgi:hypothetical protein
MKTRHPPGTPSRSPPSDAWCECAGSDPCAGTDGVLLTPSAEKARCSARLACASAAAASFRCCNRTEHADMSALLLTWRKVSASQFTTRAKAWLRVKTTGLSDKGDCNIRHRTEVVPWRSARTIDLLGAPIECPSVRHQLYFQREQGLEIEAKEKHQRVECSFTSAQRTFSLHTAIAADDCEPTRVRIKKIHPNLLFYSRSNSPSRCSTGSARQPPSRPSGSEPPSSPVPASPAQPRSCAARPLPPRRCRPTP